MVCNLGVDCVQPGLGYDSATPGAPGVVCLGAGGGPPPTIRSFFSGLQTFQNFMMVLRHHRKILDSHSFPFPQSSGLVVVFSMPTGPIILLSSSFSNAAKED